MISLTISVTMQKNIVQTGSKQSIYKPKPGFVVVRAAPEVADSLYRVFGNEGLGKEVEIRRPN